GCTGDVTDATDEEEGGDPSVRGGARGSEDLDAIGRPPPAGSSHHLERISVSTEVSAPGQQVELRAMPRHHTVCEHRKERAALVPSVQVWQPGQRLEVGQALCQLQVAERVRLAITPSLSTQQPDGVDRSLR